MILHGVGMDEGLPGVMMPGYAQSFSDAQIVELAAWMRHTLTDKAPWPDLAARVAAIRQSSQQH